MRVAIGGIVHETHTFSNVPATLDSFRARHFLLGEELFTFANMVWNGQWLVTRIKLATNMVYRPYRIYSQLTLKDIRDTITLG